MVNNYPRQSEILAEFYDRDGIDPVYLRRGTFAGDCADILAQRRSISDATWKLAHEYGWHGFIDSMVALLASPEFRSRFARLIDTQQEVVNVAERYIGHYDQRWALVDGREAIVDIKTGSLRKCTALQTAFYDLGLPINQRRRRFAIHLLPDRPGRIIQFTDDRDYDAARLAVRWFHRRRDYL